MVWGGVGSKVILVHGAWNRQQCWDSVVDAPCERRNDVSAVRLPLTRACRRRGHERLKPPARAARLARDDHVVRVAYAGRMEMFIPVGPKRTFEGVVAQIAEQIRMGTLGEGERLPAERELAAALQVSRATLRDAVRVLADAGVVTVKSGSAGGIFVASGYVPYELLQSKTEMRLGEVAGVLEARRLFEPRVAQLAASKAREADLLLMQETIDAQKAVVASGDFDENVDRFLQYGAQFHARMASATGNATIVAAMRLLLRELEAARSMTIRETPLVPDFTIQIHEETLAAIRSADQERVDRVMDEHLGSMERAWERQTGRRLVRPIPDFLRPVAERAHAASAS
jgi:GntR family transcriptional regulator, transcriptional repressor for pyruvate dehydrogenase complex